jgi:hypothetical protein
MSIRKLIVSEEFLRWFYIFIIIAQSNSNSSLTVTSFNYYITSYYGTIVAISSVPTSTWRQLRAQMAHDYKLHFSKTPVHLT